MDGTPTLAMVAIFLAVAVYAGAQPIPFCVRDGEAVSCGSATCGPPFKEMRFGDRIRVPSERDWDVPYGYDPRRPQAETLRGFPLRPIPY